MTWYNPRTWFSPKTAPKSPYLLPTGLPAGPLILRMADDGDRLLAPDHYLDGLRQDSIMDGLLGTAPSNIHGRSGGGWVNKVTGLGTRARDKVMQADFQESIRIDDPQLSALFNGNDLAQRIVSAKPKEMFRRGWVLAFPGAPEEPPAGPKGAPSTSEQGAQIKPAAGGQGAGVAMSRSDATDAGGRRVPKLPRNQKGVDRPGMGEPTRDTPAQGGDSGSPYEQSQGPKKPYDQPKNPYQVAPDPNTIQRGGEAFDLNASQTAGEGESGPAAPSGEAIAEPGAVQTAGQGDQPDNADVAKAVEEYAANLQLIPRCQEATIFGRLYGGGLLIIGADDGKDVAEPLDEENIRSIKYLTWIDRRFIVAHTYYEEIGPKYGEVQVYNIINPFGNQKNTLVHESRVIRFDGAPVDLLMRRRLAGWTLSVLQAPYDTMRQFDQSFQSVANLMSDISQAVMKINGLAQMISNDHLTLQTRMTMVDMSRSSARMVFLDAENEEFERVATPLTGVAETLEMQMLRLAAAAEMPVAILFGREPSGLNATGDADFRRFYDTIMGECKQVLEPKLRRLYTLICLCKDAPTKGEVPEGGLEFVWHKLYEPSEKEQAEIRWLMAQADDKYVANQTLLPEEVAMSRFRSGDLHLDTEIQGHLRRESLKTAQLPPSGAEKAKVDQENKQAELQVKAAGVEAKAAKAGPPGATRADGTTIEDVIANLEDDYPPEAIEWVKAARWRGPEKIPVKDIDMSGRKTWRASKDDIGPYVKRAEKKGQKPILLVKTPDNDKYIVVDGHHRLLAAEKRGVPVIAYCAKVFHDDDKSPWHVMHAKQRSGPSKGDSERPPAA